MMKITPIAAVGCLLCLASCNFKTELTPTSGPLAQKGVQSLPASFTWNGSGSGKVTVTMPDGEVCTGRYSTIAGGSQSSGYAYGSGSSYGAYGNTYSNSSAYGSSRTISNEQHGKAVARGSKGTVLTLNYVTSAANPTHGHGTGFDNKGNRYTIVF